MNLRNQNKVSHQLTGAGKSAEVTKPGEKDRCSAVARSLRQLQNVSVDFFEPGLVRNEWVQVATESQIVGFGGELLLLEPEMVGLGPGRA